MSGHSKWATTKHQKAAKDAKRSKIFAKLIKNIEVAARTGGCDLDGNPTLYDAVQKAKKSSVPNDNIERAVKRGSGADGGGADYQTITYEGYAPGGVAVLIECLTDNRNRAATEVRLAMSRNGGAMADPVLRQSLASVFVEERLLELLSSRMRDDAKAGRTPGPQGSVAKLAGARLAKHAAEVGLEVLGTAAWTDDESARSPTTTFTPLSARFSAWAWPCEPKPMMATVLPSRRERSASSS